MELKPSAKVNGKRSIFEYPGKLARKSEAFNKFIFEEGFKNAKHRLIPENLEGINYYIAEAKNIFE